MMDRRHIPDPVTPGSRARPKVDPRTGGACTCEGSVARHDAERGTHV
jgi:hypothetical protein